jgi:hypothetical protein
LRIRPFFSGWYSLKVVTVAHTNHYVISL